MDALFGSQLSNKEGVITGLSMPKSHLQILFVFLLNIHLVVVLYCLPIITPVMIPITKCPEFQMNLTHTDIHDKDVHVFVKHETKGY
jgi:hypothetical protein